MTYILDTADLPVRDRVEAVHAAMAHASAPCHVFHEDPEGDVHVRLGLWDLGSSNIFTAHATGLRLLRTGKQTRQDTMPVVALSVQQSTPGRQEQFDRHQVVAPGELMAVDLSAPYEFSWSGVGGAGCVQIGIDRLGLPVDVIRHAVANVRSSPLYPVVADHVAHLVADAGRISADPGAAALSAANVELTRALLISAGRTDRHSRAALADTLLTRIRAHVRGRLTDPDLSPATIAAAHHISVRYLYRVCAQAGFSLEQWIIDERLDGARDELARPTARHQTIATTARRWGFADPSHFARRFQARFGLAPRDWRRASAADQ